MGAKNEILGTVGRCIYCGITNKNLNDEHVLPLGLGGTWVLRKASCLECQSITSRFELDVLRHTLLPVRAKVDLPTRHKKKRPIEFPLTIERGGKELTINVPIDQYPAILALPRFKLPAYIDKRPYDKGIDLNGLYHILLGRKSLREVGKELNVDSLTYTVTYRGFKGGFSFARLLAKIAYGLAVARFGANVIDTAYVLPAILGKSDDVGKWVGTEGESSSTAGHLHDARISVENSDIYVRIRLFACLPGTCPEYLVVVGSVPSALNSNHVGASVMH
jgi:hypothetical protein